MKNNGTYIQWRYEGDTDWQNLVSLDDITGPQGEPGPQGETGATGATGPQGEQGETGADGSMSTSYCSAANFLADIVGAINIPFDHFYPSTPDITYDEDERVFTCSTAGTYLIEFNANCAEESHGSIQIMANGGIRSWTPILSAPNNLSNRVIVEMDAGGTVFLETTAGGEIYFYGIPYMSVAITILRLS